jgi:hypothetical protein
VSFLGGPNQIIRVTLIPLVGGAVFWCEYGFMKGLLFFVALLVVDIILLILSRFFN